MDALPSIISNNVNTIMKRMTSLSIVLMLLTLIASFYGIKNVDIHLEEVPFAFSLIVLFSIGLSTLAFVISRKIKWFLNSTQNLLYGILLHIIEVVQTFGNKNSLSSYINHVLQAAHYDVFSSREINKKENRERNYFYPCLQQAFLFIQWNRNSDKSIN